MASTSRPNLFLFRVSQIPHPTTATTHRLITYNHHHHHRQIMSTDLQLRQDLPPIRLTSLEIKLPASPTQLPESTSEESCTEVEDCQTPTSPEHKIPEITTCPPAPKKHARSSAPSCKRRISEFDFFEVVARDEIESFFRSTYEFINQNSENNKRRCSRL